LAELDRRRQIERAGLAIAAGGERQAETREQQALEDFRQWLAGQHLTLSDG
jgi:hypothetical protein